MLPQIAKLPLSPSKKTEEAEKVDCQAVDSAKMQLSSSFSRNGIQRFGLIVGNAEVIQSLCARDL